MHSNLEQDVSLAVYTAKVFLKDNITQFEPNITLIVHGITDKNRNAVVFKIKDIFGKNADTSEIRGTITIQPTPFQERARLTFGDLLEVMRRLRSENGCPWDKAQTHASIRENLLEEANELAEAIDLNDRDKMLEESGDVLLQAIFHAIIAEENGEFSINDMITALTKKLIWRHTHIFGTDHANNPEEALEFWKKAKAVEKKIMEKQSDIRLKNCTIAELVEIREEMA
ncbi:MAG: hypothetical protein FWD49_02940 [Firmicutes bacterium]|nr:hypothetical protein [Bacillota bacterium]